MARVASHILAHETNAPAAADGHDHGRWLPAPNGTAQQYDCNFAAGAAEWRRVCSGVVAKYRSFQDGARPLQWSVQPDVTRLMTLLDGRHVVVVGDSQAMTVLCALTCWFIGKGAVSNRTSTKRMTLSLGLLVNHWVLPACARGAGRAACEAMSNKDGWCTSKVVESMRRDEELAPLVMLYNSCDSYITSPGFSYFKDRLGRLGSISALAEWEDPLGDSFLRRPFSREPTAFSTGRAAGAMQSLRNLSETGCGYLGVSNPAMIAHFPEVPSVLESQNVSIDAPGSYERFVLSAFAWTHALLQDNETAAVSAFSLLGIVRPSWSTWKQSSGNYDPPTVVGLAHWVLQTGRCTGSSLTSASCVLSALTKFGGRGPADNRRLLRARSCAAFEGEDTRSEWRQRVLRSVAHQEGVPFLDSIRARRERWDTHPAIQSGRVSSVQAVFDCLHVSLQAGFWDGEIAALSSVLEKDERRRVACMGGGD